ncbi:GYDIA family GHMP kinase [Sinomicrobium soli]|uniref:GYDIA family GHMP kinase n=1 Tax=Sinomicrobium sp. N-1-3-6 TaxID=2219864 RepID=UPI000DCD132B|nr:GYDIA family GHMP kinase [Sinomicrobium sp. N-1-3-6]RAV29747.1 GHMP kinase [Sinomicrobium sp. N-1-3-6]
MTTKKFYGNGKLLLSGEYVVLDGAQCLAVPTVYGQQMTVAPGAPGQLHWASEDHNGNPWFTYVFDLEALFAKENYTAPEDQVALRLASLFREARNLNPGFLRTGQGYRVATRLGFPRNWGLGSSSTLVSNIADWAGVNPYLLLERTFSGSGYDIACARNNTAILYRTGSPLPEITPVRFSPAFKSCLYFVHLNRKQDSREGIRHYKDLKIPKAQAIRDITGISLQLSRCRTLEEFEQLLGRHETIIASLVALPPVKERLFPDYPGGVKSLGAWGGDFVLVTTENDPRDYFASRGYHTVLPYEDMVLC